MVFFDAFVFRLEMLAALVDSQLEFGGVRLEGSRLGGVGLAVARLERTFFQENGSLSEDADSGLGESGIDLESGSILES